MQFWIPWDRGEVQVGDWMDGDGDEDGGLLPGRVGADISNPYSAWQESTIFNENEDCSNKKSHSNYEEPHELASSALTQEMGKGAASPLM